MTDEFFTEDNQQIQQDVQETGAEETKIKLGDREYSQDELSQLVGVAEKVSSLEKQYNTKLDKVWPEFGRSQNENRTLKEQLERVQAQARGNQDLDPDTARQALEQARKLGLVTKEDFKQFMTENFRDLYRVERETDSLLGDLDGLEREIDGKDGRPKFDKIAVLEHMRENGFKSPMKAYKDMYEEQLDQWKAQKLSAKAPGVYTTTQSTQGSKQPQDVKITKNNLNDMVNAALQGEL